MADGQRAPFRVQCDGSSRNNPGPAGIGVAVIDPAGNAVKEISYALGNRTNNQAEYEALICALAEAAKLPPPVVVQLDSELLYRQLEGSYRVRNELLLPLYERARAQLDSLKGVSLQLLLRGENKLADRLARAASRAALRYASEKKQQEAKDRGGQEPGPAAPAPAESLPRPEAPGTPESGG